jgi:hypothetical protein
MVSPSTHPHASEVKIVRASVLPQLSASVHAALSESVARQFWTITRRDNSGGVLTCQEDEGKPNLITHEYWVINLPYDGDSMELVYTKAAQGIPASLYLLWEHQKVSPSSFPDKRRGSVATTPSPSPIR